MYYIYAYLREDGTFYYIGKGKNRRAYVKHSRKNGSNIVPKDTNRIKILHENLSEDEANSLEKQLICEYGRKDLGKGILINLTDGGEGTSGHIKSQDSIDKQSEKLRGKKRSSDVVEKIKKSNLGQKRTDEAKQKMKDARIGKKDSEETKEKKSRSASKSRSITHRENISKSKMGNKNPMYGKVSSRKGKSLSEDIKQKLRDANLGKKDSDETRRKKSEAQKKRHAENKLKYITKEN